ncbi:hypothetical protein JYK14_01360 [Siccirubricoccus sp. KC 17139]|uniref:Uncharacterized protein n=1 Tax=Siccirubricoccus soli TaxID=2899147 RepID=A0ABT1CYU2_9PROT|nr:hypothetical protein [Siccirubricoccus soli]MCO6414828.1 hypothetical protein [Siccirubricoccus soli]MCP2680958.1 hypothetical protein [Siccirubricoccus soli]
MELTDATLQPIFGGTLPCTIGAYFFRAAGGGSGFWPVLDLANPSSSGTADRHSIAHWVSPPNTTFSRRNNSTPNVVPQVELVGPAHILAIYRYNGSSHTTSVRALWTSGVFAAAATVLSDTVAIAGLSRMTLGARYMGGSISNHANGQVGEVFGIDKLLSDEETARALNALWAKWIGA